MGLLFMAMRSIVLFAHVLGMLVLFVALALEWWTVDLLRTVAGPKPHPFAITSFRALPRLTAIAVALILLSGIALAARVGVFGFAWVWVSFGAMVLMGTTGAIALRPMVAEMKSRSRSDADDATSRWRHLTSRPVVRTSLWIRTAVGLAIVYLMIAKPDLVESAVFIGSALILSAAGGIITGRSSAGNVAANDDGAAPQASGSPWS